MKLSQATKIILIGFVLVVLGFVLPFLMVLRVIQPNFLLSFFSYAASVVGMFLGFIGAASYVQENRRNDRGS
jgi:uncharacterized membrane protein